MHAALDINIPNYASAVVKTAEIVTSIVALDSSATRGKASLASRTGRKVHARLSAA